MIGGARKKGFTIVEVILVLAIAGLIFMMVFMAVPALRRSQRDAQRREDMLLLVENIKDYQRNNRGALPSDWNEVFSDYLGARFKDPDGVKYGWKEMTCSGTVGNDCDDKDDDIKHLRDYSFEANEHKILIIKQATCDGSEVKATSNTRRIAVLYRLEGGGEFCANT